MANSNTLSTSSTLAAFVNTYHPDGFDPITVLYNGGRTFHSFDTVEEYLNDPITIITSFLGLPNSCPDGVKQSWSNIAKQCIGWQDEVAPERAFINSLMIIPNIIWRLAVFAPTLVLNTVKLVTEFVPRALTAKLNEIEKSAVQGSFTSYAAKAGGYLTSAWAFIGGAITSPLNNVRTAWKKGQTIAKAEMVGVKDEEAKADIERAGKVLGGALAVMSMALTVAVVAVALPSVIISAAPALPTAIAGSIAAVKVAVGSSWLFGGLVVGAGLAADSIGTALDRGIDKFKNYWRKSGKKEVNSLPEFAYRSGSTNAIQAKTGHSRAGSRPNAQTQPQPQSPVVTLSSVENGKLEPQPQSSQARVAYYSYAKR